MASLFTRDFSSPVAKYCSLYYHHQGIAQCTSIQLKQPQVRGLSTIDRPIYNCSRRVANDHRLDYTIRIIRWSAAATSSIRGWAEGYLD